ncbi:MAG TPA: hypothetical protein DCP19_11280, partial [Pseudomonas sp.]|nr:hypothetical protein [Pseudomonas sp.]
GRSSTEASPSLGFAALNPTYAADLGRRVDNGAALSANGVRLAQWKTLRGFPRYRDAAGVHEPQLRTRLDRPLSLWERAGVRAEVRQGIPSLGFAALNPTYAADLGGRVDNGAVLSTDDVSCLVENAARFSTLR